MGAFISYLYLSEGIRHFFVLAPNLTIYNKLIADFTPNTAKYVFQGISELAVNPPEIITGDNYESGRGIRSGSLFDMSAIHVNIFNISKINSEVRGGKSPRIKRLSEYIGQSYFDYLAGLDDLVMLMDESHRYRASAGVRAINELNPILGLELTATPQVERGQRSEPFKNVIYSYPLSLAMTDGFVKEPAVATRENFDAANYSAEGLEKIKLEDGVRIHENTKVELEVYARNNDQPIVKPFMLVVAQDTTHANALQKVMEKDDFFEGRYTGKVITVHSNVRGEEKDDVVEQLLHVENPDNPVEVVIHVNMLKEGWDVTNLYTIVPLRAANSRTLVEQSIGRGLRLPYGKRVGVPAVDRLTIVSHDRFQEIVDHANDPNSIIRTGVIIGKDIPEAGKKAVLVRGLIDFNDISYDDHAALLYKLAGQVILHLRSYLGEEDDVLNVLQFNQQILVNLIHSQMQDHFTETATSYEARVTKGFRTLRPNNYSTGADQGTRNFRAPIPEGDKSRIASMLFGGFQKCLYPEQKFDSDSERRFSVILENDEDVLKWVKPAKGDFQIYYNHDESYEPDFFVETETGKFLCEPKRANEMTDEKVLAKADAAAVWCDHATDHAKEDGGKEWTYLLIPHDQTSEQMTLSGLEARWTYATRVQGSSGS